MKTHTVCFESGSHDEFVSKAVYKKQDSNSKREDKLAHLKDLIDGESGWKSSLPEDQNLEVTEQKLLFYLIKEVLNLRNLRRC